eukprot:1775587-Pleurochrysis_carterae.AAC.2
MKLVQPRIASSKQHNAPFQSCRTLLTLAQLMAWNMYGDTTEHDWNAATQSRALAAVARGRVQGNNTKQKHVDSRKMCLQQSYRSQKRLIRSEE